MTENLSTEVIRMKDLLKEFSTCIYDMPETMMKYEHNRDGYTEAKSEFVKEYTEKAKQFHFNSPNRGF